jgi:membrane protein insertase Oxa1/YidC/SpoIIIJ
MAKMKVIAPKLKSLQEQYANDKQQLQVKMMEMYKQEKINPLGGCLPILVADPGVHRALLGAPSPRSSCATPVDSVDP